MIRYYECTRQIGIDAAHRVPTHGSKCRNIHGHRYTIEATCRSQIVAPSGEQKDMTLDFGFLKDIMMAQIDGPADHGIMLWVHDPLTRIVQDWIERPRNGNEGLLPDQKLLILPFIPTAERLAEYWFRCMCDQVFLRSEGVAKLHKVRVWETPNCYADFSISEA